MNRMSGKHASRSDGELTRRWRAPSTIVVFHHRIPECRKDRGAVLSYHLLPQHQQVSDEMHVPEADTAGYRQPDHHEVAAAVVVPEVLRDVDLRRKSPTAGR
jgi:hypothetical protein